MLGGGWASANLTLRFQILSCQDFQIWFRRAQAFLLERNRASSSARLLTPYAL
jgi:hypothetical protein